eukprot:1859716-Prymnesium_polylepis.1
MGSKKRTPTKPRSRMSQVHPVGRHPQTCWSTAKQHALHRLAHTAVLRIAAGGCFLNLGAATLALATTLAPTSVGACAPFAQVDTNENHPVAGPQSSGCEGA